MTGRNSGHFLLQITMNRALFMFVNNLKYVLLSTDLKINTGFILFY